MSAEACVHLQPLRLGEQAGRHAAVAYTALKLSSELLPQLKHARLQGSRQAEHLRINMGPVALLALSIITASGTGQIPLARWGCALYAQAQLHHLVASNLFDHAQQGSSLYLNP